VLMSESKLQSELIKWLRSRGCFVFKVQAGPGVPTGTPDVFFCKEGFYGFCELKSSAKSKFQPLQKERLEKLHDWSWAKAVYPQNWQEIKIELDNLLAD
jgi:Holliday junction resolvase